MLPFFAGGAFRSLGLSFEIGLLIFFISLLGSSINIPIYKVRRKEPVILKKPHSFFDFIYPERENRYRVIQTTIAINVGGALVPLFLCIYILFTYPNLISQYAIGTAIIAIISFKLARPLPGIGIALPTFIPPLSAAAVALLIPGDPKAAIAFFSGVMGVLIGADLLNLNGSVRSGAEFLSIGGAGTFDGIFLTGLLSLFFVP
ncbi:MAG: DUF1614 domain-containing protein [Candidatus Hadarchaeota archaeon]